MDSRVPIKTGRAPSTRSGYGADNHIYVTFAKGVQRWETYLLIHTDEQPNQAGRKRGTWRGNRKKWETKYTLAAFDKDKREEARRFRSMVGRLFTSEKMVGSPYSVEDALTLLAAYEKRETQKASIRAPDSAQKLRWAVLCPCGHTSMINKSYWTRNEWVPCRGCGVYIQRDTGSIRAHGWYYRLLGEAAGVPEHERAITKLDPKKHRKQARAIPRHKENAMTIEPINPRIVCKQLKVTIPPDTLSSLAADWLLKQPEFQAAVKGNLLADLEDVYFDEGSKLWVNPDTEMPEAVFIISRCSVNSESSG